LEGDFAAPTLTEKTDFDFIVASSRFAFALKDTELWACGDNERGQLGLGSTESVSVFTKVQFYQRVQQVACGWEHSVLLAEDGSVYATGHGSKGQLGFGAGQQSCQKFTKVALPKRIKQVCCGVWFTLALTEEGQIFGWGSNRDRCLAEEPIACFFDPITLSFQHGDVIKLSAGHRHVVALRSDQTVLGWGDNRFQQFPSIAERAIDCFAGWHHSVIQVSEFECLIYGKNDYNQLAHVDPSVTCNRIRFQDAIKRIAVGSDHTLVLLSNGELLSFGWNEHGVLGNESNETKHGEICHVKLFGREVEEIFAGYGSCFILTAPRTVINC
jgi:alpha-tubulin suppressor-like RCC1 family protein